MRRSPILALGAAAEQIGGADGEDVVTREAALGRCHKRQERSGLGVRMACQLSTRLAVLRRTLSTRLPRKRRSRSLPIRTTRACPPSSPCGGGGEVAQGRAAFDEARRGLGDPGDL